MADGDYSATRRGLLVGTGAAACAAALPTIANAAPTASRDELLNRYNAWLHMERRLLAMEMWPDYGAAAEDFVPVECVARSFHFPRHGNGRSVSPPSARAVAVLGAAGVSLLSEDEWRARRAEVVS